MKSNGVSLKPPFKAFANGVRRARVMTISSAFLVVLEEHHYTSIVSKVGDRLTSLISSKS
jgi:hypothetical protein